MRKYLIAALAALPLAFAACASGPGPSEFKKELDSIEQYSRATLDKVENLKKEDIQRINQTLNTLLVRVQELSLTLSRMQAKPSEPVQTKGVNETIDDLFNKLRSYPDPEKLAPEFKQAGELVLPRLTETLKSDDPSMRVKALKVLEKLDPKIVGPAVVELLDDNLPVTSGLILLLGNIGYIDAAPKIRPFINSADSEIRFYASDAMVKFKTPEAIVILMQYLRDPADQRRAFAFDTLSRCTGKDFDYKYYMPDEIREESVKMWEDWWTKESKTFVFPGK